MDDNAEIPMLKDEELRKMLKNISRKSLKMRWASSRKNLVKNLKEIPLVRILYRFIFFLTEEDETVEYANARNQEIYPKFAEERTELQMYVQHDVAVYKPIKGVGKRQRKGTQVRTFSRPITLLDAASQYLYALLGGERLVSATEMMRFNSLSLVSLYLVALAMREMIDAARPGSVERAGDEGIVVQ